VSLFFYLLTYRIHLCPHWRKR